MVNKKFQDRQAPTLRQKNKTSALFQSMNLVPHTDEYTERERNPIGCTKWESNTDESTKQELGGALGTLNSYSEQLSAIHLLSNSDIKPSHSQSSSSGSFLPLGSSISAANSTAFTKSFGLHEEWYSRNLPHRDKEGLIQFITFRLADSLPQNVIQQIESELLTVNESDIRFERRKRYEIWLDAGYGCCALAHPEMARIMQNA
ncbi:MAG: hypothetical protein ABIN48_09615 [Ginsengibacter sp.]